MIHDKSGHEYRMQLTGKPPSFCKRVMVG